MGPEPEDTAENRENTRKEEETDDPVKAIFRIIDRYYEGLKREEEGMGVD